MANTALIPALPLTGLNIRAIEKITKKMTPDSPQPESNFHYEKLSAEACGEWYVFQGTSLYSAAHWNQRILNYLYLPAADKWR